MSNDKAIEAAALALKAGAPRELANHDFTPEAKVAIEAAAPLLRAEVEREVVEWIDRNWEPGDIDSTNAIARMIEAGDHRKEEDRG